MFQGSVGVFLEKSLEMKGWNPPPKSQQKKAAEKKNHRSISPAQRSTSSGLQNAASVGKKTSIWVFPKIMVPPNHPF